MSNLKILVVDDEIIGRQLLQAILLDLNYIVEEASNGKEVLKKLEFVCPDLIMLDIMMPEMDGFKTLEKIRSDPKFHDLPVIIVSALDDRDSKIKGGKLGATDFITKPYNKDQISKKIQKILHSDVHE